MRVLHVIDSGGLYGAETMILSLMSEQARLGLQPTLASIGATGEPEKPIEREARQRGLSVTAFRMRPGPNLPGAARILSFARKNGTSLLHCHGYKADILFGFVPRWLRPFPLVGTVHGWTWSSGWARMRLYTILDGWSLRRFDAVVLVDAAMSRHRCIRALGRAAVHVVPNGIPRRDQVGGMAPPDEDVVRFCRESFVVGGIGRLSREKGFDVLLRAIAALAPGMPDLRCLILGEGRERGSLDTLTAEMGIRDRVFFAGYREHARRLLPLLSVLAIPSRSEGLPILLLEAMREGIPIIAARVGGMPAALDAGLGGMIFEPEDVDSLAGALLDIRRDPAAARRRVEHARAAAEARFGVTAMVRSYAEIYESMLSRGGGS